MSKFRKVADTTNIPQNIEEGFFGKTASVQDDRYAELRAGQAERAQRLAREESFVKREARKTPHEWERNEGAARYSDRQMNPVDDQLSNLRPEDCSGSGIRRAFYDTDDETLAMRDTFKWGTADDYMNAMMRGASMWDPELEVVTEALQVENDKRDEMVERRSNVERRQERHASWEQQQMNSLRPRKHVSSSRANPLIRTSMENVSDSAFGLPNYDAIAEREAERMAVADRRREEKLSIKAQGIVSRSERHSQWEDGIQSRAQRIQDADPAWMDSLLMGEDA